ncbi:MAG TPA: diaminopimelate decarboxylase [Cyclobacteriaceae bacterium]
MELKNNGYQLQGIPVTEICQQFGTPLYVYDADKIVSQLKILQHTFAESNVKVKYAAKALTSLSVLKLLKKNGSGIDVVSVNEAQLALRAGFEPKEIMFTSNNVSIDEIEEAVELGIYINMDNLSILEKFGQKYGSSYPCCLRLNPSIMAGGNLKISTGHSKSKFGIPVEQMSQIKELVSRYQIVVNGLHIHTGSEIKDVDVFMKMADILFELAIDFKDVKFLDFGGGFKVSYKSEDHVTDMPALGSRLNTAFKDFNQKHNRNLELWIEPGKFIVSDSGYLFTKVNIVKKNPSITFLGVDSGLNHLIRPMMYDSYHEIVNVSNPSGEKRTYTVVGNICETDTLGADRSLNEVREGDLLAFQNAGAYGYAMASTYNSRFRPAEVLVIDGKAKLIRQRDTMEDLLRGQIDIF